MKKNYFLLLLTILFSGITFAQEAQKNFINYQGVARNASNELIVSEAVTIGIALKSGSANGPAMYEEIHSITTDANGVFSLQIGDGSSASGDYNSLSWGSVATFITVSMNGSKIGTTEMMSVPYAISSGKAVNQSAAEVLYDNTASGLSATTAQDAIDELMTGGSVDADTDPSNEFQSLSFDAGTNELSLSDGNSVTIPSGGTDADADPTNEIQTISFDAASNKISLTDGGEITIPSGGTDADADPTNEIQTLNFDAVTNELSLTDGNTVTIPSGGTDADADPTNEIQTISFDVGTNELSLSDGGVVTIPSGGTDADADPTNEIQTISFDVGTNELSLSDGGVVTIPSGGTDADADPYNEFQTLNFDAATNELSLTDGNTVTIPSGGTDADADPTNEIQTISFDPATNELSLSDGGAVTIPSGGADADADPENEIDVTRRHGLLVGDDGIVDGLVGTADGQVAKWNAALGNWQAGTDETGAGGGSSLWTQDGDNIIYAGGRVGIGAGSALSNAVLEVAGGANSEGILNVKDTELVGRNLAISGFGLQGRFDGANSSLSLNRSGGDVSIGNGGTTVGIGMTGFSVAESTLDVNGDIRSRNLSGGGNVVADADGNLVIGAGGGGSSLWSENGDNIYFNAGNVGIGKSNPDVALDIETDLGASIRTTSTTANNYMTFLNSLGYAGISGVYTDNRSMDFGTPPANSTGTVNLITRGTPKLTVAANGNVGIGTNSPEVALHVQANGQIAARFESSSANNFMVFHNNGGYKGYAGIWSGDNDMDFGTGAGNSNGKVHLTTNSTPKLTVAANGNVGIGTQTPTSKLHIQGGQALGAGLRISDGLNADWDIINRGALAFLRGGTVLGIISTTGAYVQSSDERMKENIKPLEPTLGKVLRLRPATYNYKADSDKKNTLGLIAQEVQPLFPELVSTSGDEGMLGVDYGGFSIVAIRAIQEQQQIIDEQSEQISDLENRLKKIEEMLQEK